MEVLLEERDQRSAATTKKKPDKIDQGELDKMNKKAWGPSIFIL